MQANGAPGCAALKGNASRTDNKQVDDSDNSDLVVTGDICTRLELFLCKWSKFHLDELCCDPAADGGKPLGEVYTPFGYERMSEDSEPGNC